MCVLKVPKFVKLQYMRETTIKQVKKYRSIHISTINKKCFLKVPEPAW